MACVLVSASETARGRGGREDAGKESGDGGGDGGSQSLLPFSNGGGW